MWASKKNAREIKYFQLNIHLMNYMFVSFGMLLLNKNVKENLIKQSSRRTSSKGQGSKEGSTSREPINATWEGTLKGERRKTFEGLVFLFGVFSLF